MSLRPFFTQVRDEFSRQIDERKEGYNWGVCEYKIYPSTHIQSFVQCPKETIQVKVHEAPNYGIDTKYSFAYGSALHNVYQGAAKTSPTMLYDKPNLPAELQDKAKWIWPEVPVQDLPSGTSGRADLVLRMDDEPVPFELKTTASDRDKWIEDRRKKPNSNHKVQVAIYAHIMNRDNYYDKKIRKCGCGYINFTYAAPGFFENEYEVYFDFTNEMDEKIGSMLEHLALQRDAYLAGEDIPCTFPFCRRHNR